MRRGASGWELPTQASTALKPLCEIPTIGSPCTFLLPVRNSPDVVLSRCFCETRDGGEIDGPLQFRGRAFAAGRGTQRAAGAAERIGEAAPPRQVAANLLGFGAPKAKLGAQRQIGANQSEA